MSVLEKFREERILRGLSTRLSYVLRPFDQWLTMKAELAAPPIFISGLARSGTTLVYQSFVHEFNAGSIRHFLTWFPASPVLISHLAYRWCPNTQGETRFVNDYGQGVGSGGLSQGHEIWKRWFPWDGDDDCLEERDRKSLRKMIAGLEKSMGEPLIMKWPGFVAHLDDLRITFPQALFVFVDRDTEAVVRSIANGRLKLRGSLDKPISRSPEGGHLDGSDDGLEGIVNYVRSVRHRIARFQKEVPAGQVTQLCYEEFCQDPRRCISVVIANYERWSGVKLRAQGTLPAKFEISKGVALPGYWEDALRELALCDTQGENR